MPRKGILLDILMRVYTAGKSKRWPFFAALRKANGSLLIVRDYSFCLVASFLFARLTRAKHDLSRPLRDGWLHDSLRLRRLSLVLRHASESLRRLWRNRADCLANVLSPNSPCASLAQRDFSFQAVMAAS